MKPKNNILHHFALIALAFAGLSAHSAQAALYWDTNSTTGGSGTSAGTWGTDAFWNSDTTGGAGGSFTAATGSGDNLFFNANSAGSTGTVTVSGTQLANTITLQTNVAVPLTTGTIALTSGATNQTATAWNIGAAVSQAGSSQLWTIAGAGNINLNGLTTVNASNVILTKAGAGAGVLSLAGGLTFNSSSGTTFATSGTTAANTSIGGTTTFGAGTSAMTVSGSTFTLAGGITNSSGSLQTINNPIVLSNANHTFTATSGDINLGGAFSGLTQNVTFVGAGTTTLSGTNMFNTAGSNFGGLIVGGAGSTAGNVAITGATTVDGTGAVSTTGGLLDIHGTSTLTIQTGGSLSINSVINAGGNRIIGQNAAGTSTLLVNGGSLTINGAQGFALGNNINTAIGVLTISSGTATIAAGSATLQDGRNFIAMGRDNATGIINLDGGTLETGRQFVRDGSSGGTAGSGTATFNFNGGTLKALADQTLGSGWFETANAGNFRFVTTTVKSGGAKINTNGFTANINTVLAHDSGLGGTADGGLTKSGSGTLTLGAANTYTGPTTISAGRLNVISPGSIDNTSAVALGAATLGGNGTLGAVTVNNAGAVISNGNANTGTLNLGSLTFTTGATLNLNKANDTFTPALAITGNLATTSGITVNIPAGPVWANGDYDLISFGSGPVAGPTPDLTVGSIAGLGGRQSAALSSTGFSIILTIGGDIPVWTGVGSQTWTTAATNDNTGPNAWALKNGHTPTNFWDNDSVEFNDTYNLSPFGDVAVSNSTVTIHGGVAPATVTFNNTTGVDYVIASDDSTGITTGTLSKNGDGIVTLNTTNTYAGATIITAGTLRLGDGTTNGDIASSSSIANDGTLILNRSTSSFTYANVISGFGSVVKNGTGTQIFSASNTYFGGTTINAGTLQVGTGGTTGALGAGPINNNGSLVFNRSDALAVTASITGTGSVTQVGTGALSLSGFNSYSGGTFLNSGTIIVTNNSSLGSGTVTLAGGTLSGTTGADITLANPLVAQASTTSGLFTNGKNLSLTANLTGSGNLNRTATGAAATVFLGGDNSGFSGTFTVDANGSAATRFSAATAGSQAAKWVINQPVSTRASLDFAVGTIQFGSLTGTGFLTSGGNNTIEVGNLGLSETFSGVLNQVTGKTLTVTKVGAGTWTLTGTNTYTGDTNVNAGVLAVNGNAIANANKLVINGGKVNITGTEVVGTLFFGGVQQANGLWGSTSSSAPLAHQDDSRFTGTGVVSVTTGPAGYSAWADLYAPGQTKDQDHDNDGVKNGIEYFMGQTGSTFTANPAAVSGTVTWTMGATYSGVYGTDYEVQSSPDLVTWTQVPIGSGDNTVTVNPGPSPARSVVYDVPTGGKSFVRLVVKN